MKIRKLENFKSKRGQQLPQSLYSRSNGAFTIIIVTIIIIIIIIMIDIINTHQ